MTRVHRWERWKRPSERAPRAERGERRTRTPLPPPAVVRPDFTPRVIGDVAVLVSAGAARLPPQTHFEALADHGSLSSASRETKHRFKQGTLVVVHSAATREVLLLTAPELRAMRGSVDPRRRSG